MRRLPQPAAANQILAVSSSTTLFGIEAAWKPKRARGVAQIWLAGSVQADRQSPSIITRSPVERAWAKACKYLPTGPPLSWTIRKVADADVMPHANMAAQSNRSRKRTTRPPPALSTNCYQHPDGNTSVVQGLSRPHHRFGMGCVRANSTRGTGGISTSPREDRDRAARKLQLLRRSYHPRPTRASCQWSPSVRIAGDPATRTATAPSRSNRAW